MHPSLITPTPGVEADLAKPNLTAGGAEPALVAAHVTARGHEPSLPLHVGARGHEPSINPVSSWCTERSPTTSSLMVGGTKSCLTPALSLPAGCAIESDLSTESWRTEP